MGDHLVETNEIGPPADGPVKNRSAVYILGGVEMLAGIAVVVLEMTTLIMFYKSGAPGYLIEFAGLWAGVFAVITGILQVLAAKKEVTSRTRRWFFLAGIGTALVCIIQSLVMTGLTTMNIYLIRSEISRREDRAYQVSDNLTVDQLKDLAMLKSILALIYIVLAVLAMISVGLACCNVCGKKSGFEPDQVVYSSVDGKQVKQIKIYRKAQHIKS